MKQPLAVAGYILGGALAGAALLHFASGAGVPPVVAVPGMETPGMLTPPIEKSVAPKATATTSANVSREPAMDDRAGAVRELGAS